MKKIIPELKIVHQLKIKIKVTIRCLISVEGVRVQASDADPIDFVIVRNLRVCDVLYILIQTLYQTFGNHHHLLCVLHLKSFKKRSTARGLELAL